MSLVCIKSYTFTEHVAAGNQDMQSQAVLVPLGNNSLLLSVNNLCLLDNYMAHFIFCRILSPYMNMSVEYMSKCISLCVRARVCVRVRMRVCLRALI